MKNFTKLALLAVTAGLVMSAPVSARELGDTWSKERFQIRVRGIGVLPDSGGHTTVNGSPEADNAVVPELDISYFFTKHIAAELILATSPHDLKLKDSDLGTLDLGKTMILPPTLTLQYHFTPDNKFSPYLGAGINYTLPYAEDNGRDVAKLQADGSFGWALQAGADYWLNEHWGINVDVKKVWVDVDASINSGAVKGEVELNPLIIGVGASYRF